MKNERMQANTRLKGTFRHRGDSSWKADLQDVTIPLHIILGLIVPLPLRRVRRTQKAEGEAILNQGEAEG
jgi:hypothetical protein